MRALLPTVCVAFLLLVCVASMVGRADSSEPTVCSLTDFEGAYCSEVAFDLNVPPILGYDAFYGGPGNPSTAAVSCVTDRKEPQTHSQVARVEYDVTRLRSYAGFWMQWAIKDFDIEEWDTLCFDIRGCDPAIAGDCFGHGAAYAGFTSRIKVELKVRGWGWRTIYLDAVTPDWHRVEASLADFVDTTWDVPSTNEFVITFEQREATVDRGMVYIDNISFVRKAGG